MNSNPDSKNEGHSLADSGEALLQVVLEKGIYHGTTRAVRKDGGRIILDLAMTLVRDYRTRMASVVCPGRDITDESELRAELRDARKMDAIGTVASGVAHDFNNLLMVISAYAELGATDTLLRSSLAPELAGDIVRFAKSGGLDAADAGIGPRADAGSTFGEPEFYCGRHLPVASSSDWGGRRTVRFAGEGRWMH